MLNSSSTTNPLTVKYYRSGWKTTNAIYLGTIPWPNDSGTYNPCPPGWEVPRREQWQTPLNLVNRGGGAYGRPTDLNLPSDYSFLDGTMTVNNCGKYIVVGDAEGTPTNSDDIYYFYPSAGYRFLGTTLFLPGAMGNYQTSDKFELGLGAAFGTLQFYFNSGPVFFYEDLGSNSSSVRCVLKQEKKPVP